MIGTRHSVTRDGQQRFGNFLASLSRQADAVAQDEAAILRSAKASLAALVAHDDWLVEEFASPHPIHYQQYLLFCDPNRRFSVVSFVWGPGQETPIHDHTTWGLVGMLRGAEISEAFEIRDGKPVGGIEERLEPGDVAEVSPSLGDIHRVRNAFQDRSSISIHVYGGDIGAIERHVYPLEGGTKSFISGYSNRFLPNPWGTWRDQDVA